MTFFAEWLQLSKEQFRILVMLADIGTFRGSLADMCRYVFVDPQTRNRNRFRNALDELVKQGYITSVQEGRIYNLSIVPKEKEITISAEYVARIRRHDYHTEAVAWEIVLKVLLWLSEFANGTEFQNSELATGVGSSVSQCCAAKNVLEREYEAFVKEYTYHQACEGVILRKGQVVNMCAWWN